MAADDLLTLRAVQHARLSRETTWTAIGDISLLDAPKWVPVILSRSLMPAQIATEARRIEDAVRAGAVAVGGFVSPAEKQVARQLARLPELKVVRVVPFSLHNYPLTEAVKQRLRDGRTLLLSGCAEGDSAITRANCVRTNRWVLELCEASVPTTVSASLEETLPPPQVEVALADDPAAIFL